MASMAVFSLSTCPSIISMPSARAYSMIICISSQPSPRPFRSERTRTAYSPRVVVGVGVQADDAEHLAGRLIDGDERHGARVVDLGEARDEGVAELLHRREEPQPQVLRRDRGEERPIERLVLRPHRADQNRRSVAQRRAPFPFLGIGPDRKARMAGGAAASRFDRRHRHARIDRDARRARRPAAD